jgi:hypothetical protein
MRTIAPLFALLLTLPTVAGAQQPARRDSLPRPARRRSRASTGSRTAGTTRSTTCTRRARASTSNPILSGFYPIRRSRASATTTT